jgi:hypothetical protein
MSQDRHTHSELTIDSFTWLGVLENHQPSAHFHPASFLSTPRP